MKHIVYILKCKGDRYYTGYTTDLTRRYKEHTNGTRKCKFTRSFPPICIAASWEFDTKSDALKVEYRIKRLSRNKKQDLIISPHLFVI